MKKVIALMVISGMTIGLAGCGAQKKAESEAAKVESAVSSAAAVVESTVSSAAAAADEVVSEAEAAIEETVSEAVEVAAAVESVVEEAVAVESVAEAVVVESVEEAVESAAEAVVVESVAEAVAGDSMSYEDFMAAAVDDEVVVETYVQAKQSWWDDKATVYTQNEDGAFFAYNMTCPEEDYEKLVEGQKIKITGYKAEWAGEIEIADATFEIEDGNYIAEPVDVTDKLGTDELADFMNQKVLFKGLTVEASEAAAEESGVESVAEAPAAAFLYNWDGSGQQGDDLYFKASDDKGTYTFTVESYLCGKDTDVYKAVEGLKVGDKIDLEGFLYWYEGANPHIISVSVSE